MSPVGFELIKTSCSDFILGWNPQLGFNIIAHVDAHVHNGFARAQRLADHTITPFLDRIHRPITPL